MRLLNPLDAAADRLATTLLPGMAGMARRNVSRGNRDLALFTIGQVTLPASAPADAEHLETGLRRWCAARMERIERESRAQWRQGLWALRSGLVLFVVGLVLSTGFLEPDVPGILQDLFGNGVFSVIAWIGLWYPLDLLLFARSPAKREMRALDALATMPVEVRTRGRLSG